MDYDSVVNLSKDSLVEIQWWVNNVSEKNGKLIRPCPVQLWIQTDSSLSGWGAFCPDLDLLCNGRWSILESNYHINYLELLANFMSLKFIG
ncbi:hypothetical protein SNE40_014293 [Patella caerulea]|uniref:Uncharacterized protein n=1 Tax=Patella caerulea TaxID=87958 RepID=A0AAN8PIW0_PATCE